MATALDVRELSVRFDTQHGNVQAVDSISFSIEEGETLGQLRETLGELLASAPEEMRSDFKQKF